MFIFSIKDQTSAIRCYKCKGDDECDFKSRQIYIDNCTWATKCWVIKKRKESILYIYKTNLRIYKLLYFWLIFKGARIGDHYIRSCADDRCDIQIGVGSYVESKCCYTDMCNNEDFFYPNRSASIMRTSFQLGFILVSILFLQYFIRRIFHCF